MDYFRSLNCTTCDSPLARVANQPRSPYSLYCGSAVCQECLEKDKLNEKENQKHQCIYEDCLAHAKFAHFLIDVLSRDSLMISSSGNGYVLAKSFTPMQCISCHGDYSLDKRGKAPHILQCKHVICQNCISKKRTYHIAGVNQYKARCPTCRVSVCVNPFPNAFNEFLRELPQMTKQYEELNALESSLAQECSGCKSMERIDKMYECESCNNEKFCGFCAFEDHREHEIVKLIFTESKRISEQVKAVTSNQIGTYQKIFPDLQKELNGNVKRFKKDLLAKADTITTLKRLEDVHEKQKQIEPFGIEFEAASEEYMPHLRSFNTKVKNLHARLSEVEE